LGNDFFVEFLQPFLNDHEKAPEFPKTQRLILRPNIDVIFKDTALDIKTQRNLDIKAAYLQYGFGMTEIARCFNLYYSSVSKFIANE
jgi:hypothetical protein